VIGTKTVRSRALSAWRRGRFCQATVGGAVGTTMCGTWWQEGFRQEIPTIPEIFGACGTWQL